MTKNSEKKSVHIIICINPMVDIYLKELIGFIEPDDYQVIEFYPRTIIFSHEDIKKRRFNHSGPFAYIRDVRKCIHEIEEIANTYQAVHFYFAHPFNAVTNYFFFSKIKKFRFHLIPDGIANYYNVTTRSFLLKMYAKKAVSLITGIPFTQYYGHLTGIDTHKFDTLFAFSEIGLISGDTPVIRIDLKLKKERTAKTRRQLLILGQSYSSYKQYKNRQRDIFEFVQSKYSEKYDRYYKSHPNEKVVPEFLDILRNYGIEMITSERPIEYFAGNYEIIISQASSALSNIRILYGSDIICIGFIQIPKASFWNRYRRNRLIEMKEHLLRTGVDIIE